jgi:drug/metabolite transporter (DMT)-like permease
VKQQQELTSNTVLGIALKVGSVALFVGMASCIKAAGEVPAGQIVFFRSFFAVLPIIVFLAWRGELRTALHTQRPLGHVARGLVGVTSMALGFFALTRLPLPEAITLGYAQPLLIVAFSAVFLGETVRLYRWSAVAVGMIGVVIVSWPNLTLFGAGAVDNRETVGVIAALAAAAFSAVALLLVRGLVATERSATIALWFSLTASALAVLSIPFGWQSLTPVQALLLICSGFFGGTAQIIMTEAYRHAEASTAAPFEYTSLLLGILIGYFVFDDTPTAYTIVGGAIVAAAGIFIVWRERQLGIERRAASMASTPE